MFIQIENTTFNTEYVKRISVNTNVRLINTTIYIDVIDSDNKHHRFMKEKIKNNDEEAIESTIFTYNDFIYKILTK